MLLFVIQMSIEDLSCNTPPTHGTPPAPTSLFLETKHEFKDSLTVKKCALCLLCFASVKWTVPPVIGPQESNCGVPVCHQRKSGVRDRNFISETSVDAPNHYQEQTHLLAHVCLRRHLETSYYYIKLAPSGLSSLGD